ncbi:hypothetical protein AnigIFM63604_001263 [Aspergillus niger]|uniref:Uncharacterized protein n=1 Tax=Aspergillus niger TaxID=5061 RepID=A0A9W6EDG8_ASPNG|nr:hypothetical protein AnigIFM63604_001263 [Aspergillus niger]
MPNSGRKSVAPEFEAFEMLGNRVLLVCKTAPTRDPVIEIGGEFKEEGQHQGMKAWLTLVTNRRSKGVQAHVTVM